MGCACNPKILIIILFAVFSSLGYSLIDPLYPLEASPRGISETLIGFIFSSYAINNFIFIAFSSAAIHFFGKNCLLIFSLIVEGICTILFGLISFVGNTTLFIVISFALRLSQGMASAFLSTLIYSIGAGFSTKENIERNIGYLEVGEGLGLTIGPIIASFGYQAFGFWFPFLICGGAEILAVVLVHFLGLKKTRGKKKHNKHLNSNNNSKYNNLSVSNSDLSTSLVRSSDCSNSSIGEYDAVNVSDVSCSPKKTLFESPKLEKIEKKRRKKDKKDKEKSEKTEKNVRNLKEKEVRLISEENVVATGESVEKRGSGSLSESKSESDSDSDEGDEEESNECSNNIDNNKANGMKDDIKNSFENDSEKNIENQGKSSMKSSKIKKINNIIIKNEIKTTNKITRTSHKIKEKREKKSKNSSSSSSENSKNSKEENGDFFLKEISESESESSSSEEDSESGSSPDITISIDENQHKDTIEHNENDKDKLNSCSDFIKIKKKIEVQNTQNMQNDDSRISVNPINDSYSSNTDIISHQISTTTITEEDIKDSEISQENKSDSDINKNLHRPNLLRLLIRPKIFVIFLSCFCEMAASEFFTPGFSNYLIDEFGLDENQSSFFFSFNIFTYLITLQFLRCVVDLMNPKLVIGIGWVFNSAFILLIAPDVYLPHNYVLIIVGLCLMGVCTCFISVPAVVELINIINQETDYEEDEANDLGSAIYNFAYSLGQAVGPLLGGFLIETVGFVRANEINAIINIVLFIPYLIVMIVDSCKNDNKVSDDLDVIVIKENNKDNAVK